MHCPREVSLIVFELTVRMASPVFRKESSWSDLLFGFGISLLAEHALDAADADLQIRVLQARVVRLLALVGSLVLYELLVLVLILHNFQKDVLDTFLHLVMKGIFQLSFRLVFDDLLEVAAIHSLVLVGNHDHDDSLLLDRLGRFLLTYFQPGDFSHAHV